MFANKDVARLSGIPHPTVRQLVFQRIMRPEGPNGQWTKGQALGLCAMRHARLVGASMSAAVGAYEILRRADWSALRAACDGGKQYLRIFGEVVDRQLVTERAAFDRRVRKAATREQMPFVVVDVRHWLNRTDLAEQEALADRRREKQPA
jgi:hypothetical protein